MDSLDTTTFCNCLNAPLDDIARVKKLFLEYCQFSCYSSPTCRRPIAAHTPTVRRVAFPYERAVSVSVHRNFTFVHFSTDAHLQ